MHRAHSVLRRSSAALVCASALVTAAHADTPRLRAEIRWTSHGIPHVIAPNIESAGFGEGYALAKLDICEIAGRWVTLNAQRSKYFGPQALVPTFSNDPTGATNLQSDFFWQWVRDSDLVGRELKEKPPRGPSTEIRQLVRGYVAGYNLYLKRIGVDKIPDPRCRGAAWIRPITENDVYLDSFHWSWFLTSVPLIPQFDSAAPPSGENPRAARAPTSRMPAVSLARALQIPHEAVGSNMIGLGKDATQNGQGMLFANPHWYWNGPERFLEVQLTVPGKLDVYGVATLGLPIVAIGETRHLAWSHTVAASTHATVYQLKLAPGDPTSYIYGHSVRKLKKRTVQVQVRDAAGKLVTRSHAFWETSYGLMVEDKIFPWTKETAYALRDADYGLYWMNKEMALDHAQSVEDVIRASRRFVGIPWLNTVAADAAGRTLYADNSAVPHVTDEMLDACLASGVGKRLLPEGTMVLDGSRPACAWGSDADSIEPGTFGPAELPQLVRSDYVTNSNDSYWTTNLHQLLDGYPRIMGSARTPRSLRTRMGLLKLERRLNGRDGLPGDRFTLANLESITMNDRVLSGELWRDAAVGVCRSLPAADDAAEACDVLAKWDLTEDTDSRGAVLWRRFFENLYDDRDWRERLPLDLFSVQFDPADPMSTPRGLNTGNPEVQHALLSAISDLRNARIPLNAALRGYQYADRNGVHIPVPGGPGAEGQYNVVINSNGWQSPIGWPDVNGGSSYVMWTQFTPRGPVGRSILTYSQSPNPDSPFFADQTRMFSQKKSKAILFTDEQIAADPDFKVEEICSGSGGSGCR